MDLSAGKPKNNKLIQAFAAALRGRARKTIKHHETPKTDRIGPPKVASCDDRLLEEAFLAKVFATISAVKAAYAQLQSAQFPYDPDEIQSADGIITSELNKLSGLKQCYANNVLDELSPEKILLLCEIRELDSLLVTYRVTCEKLESQLRLKDSEIIFLREKLSEARADNNLLENRLLSLSGDDVKLSGLRPGHFIQCLLEAVNSARAFTCLLMSEMGFAGWDLKLAASSIQPGIKPDHLHCAFESFVCREMFDGFNGRDFRKRTEVKTSRCSSFERFLEVKPTRPVDYIADGPKSEFAGFCREKYLRLMRPKLERSIFGNLGLRESVGSGEFPNSPFFTSFCEMAKDVWLLHCLALSFDPEVSVFRVKRMSRFSEVYMECVNDDVAFSVSTFGRVGFTVVPGFIVGGTIVQCQVYLG